MIEDKRFLFHPGVDPIAIGRALLARTFRVGRLQGGSTITQQLYNVRSQCPGFRHPRTLSWKLQQAAWALWKDAATSKVQILSDYLSAVYWGRSYYGIDAAAKGYFGTAREHLNSAQGFFLAERLARPNSVSIARVRSLLQRPLISEPFRSDIARIAELARIYEMRFGCGGDLWHYLVRSSRRSVVPISMSWSDVLNAP
jgi:membrane peptidoglycan carboxypeptidase